MKNLLNFFKVSLRQEETKFFNLKKFNKKPLDSTPRGF